MTLPKFNSACYAKISFMFIKNNELSRTVYFAYVHSILSYGIIFWVNSQDSGKVFIIQKRVISLMLGLHKTESCRYTFKKHNILPLACEYILANCAYIVDNCSSFNSNFNIHKINTRSKCDLHRPSAKLNVDQKGVHFP